MCACWCYITSKERHRRHFEAMLGYCGWTAVPKTTMLSSTADPGNRDMGRECLSLPLPAQLPRQSLDLFLQGLQHAVVSAFGDADPNDVTPPQTRKSPQLIQCHLKSGLLLCNCLDTGDQFGQPLRLGVPEKTQGQMQVVCPNRTQRTFRPERMQLVRPLR